MPVIRVKYDRFRTGEEIAKVVIEEWHRHQSIAVVDFKRNSKLNDETNESDSNIAVDSPSKNLKVAD